MGNRLAGARDLNHAVEGSVRHAGFLGARYYFEVDSRMLLIGRVSMIPRSTA